jgi:lysophospholipase L1-like esterase
MVQKLGFRNKVIYYSAPYVVFLLLLLGVDLVVRSFFPYVPSINLYVAGQTHADDKVGAVTYEGDPLLGWRLKANLTDHWWDYTMFSTNEQHFRHRAPIGRKGSDTLRIICLGDSITFGYRVPLSFPQNPQSYVRSELPYAWLLEDKLKKLYPGKKIEAIAMAVPGYTSHQGLAWLKRDIDWLEPDIVTVSYGWNDTDTRELPDKVTLTTDRLKVIARWLIAHSQAAIYATRWVQSIRSNKPANQPRIIQPRVSQEDYVDNTIAIAKLGREHGAKVIIIGQQYRDAVTHPPQARLISVYRKALATASQAADFDFLLIPELTEDSGNANEKLFGEIVHPNAAGHELIATRLEEMMVKRHFLEKGN